MLIERFKEKVNIKIILLTFVLFIITLVVINGKYIGVEKLKEISNGVGILDMEFMYSVSKSIEIVDKLTDAGRSFYLSHIIPLDIIFPLTYMLFFSSVIIFLINRLNSVKKINNLIYLPLVAMSLDYLENIMAIIILKSYPNKLLVLYSFLNVFTLLKFIALILIVIIISVLIIIIIVKGKKKHE